MSLRAHTPPPLRAEVPPTIHHVVFDCIGVIITVTDAARRRALLSSIAGDMKIRSPSKVPAEVWHDRELWDATEHGIVTSELFFQQAFQRLGVVDKELQNDYKKCLREGGVGVAPEMKSLLADIRNATMQDGTQRRFGLHVLSNYDDELLQVLSHVMGGDEAVKGTFDNVFNSAELHLAKPDPECYRAVLSALGIPPGEEHTVLFIDDQKQNIDAAENLGIHTVHFTCSDSDVAVEHPTECIRRMLGLM